MTPTLSPGDYVLISKARALRPGFVVLVAHSKYGTIIKRVASVETEGIWLEGDGPKTTSSEDMGLVTIEDIKGRARLGISPKGVKWL